jgi:hypothetical protein
MVAALPSFYERTTMAKVGLLYVGTSTGMRLLSDPGAMRRWFMIGQTLNEKSISSIWPDAESAQTVFAGSESGLHLSTDGCQTWQLVFNVPIAQVIGHPRQAGIIYLCTTQGLIFRYASAKQWQGCTELPISEQHQLVVSNELAQQLTVLTGQQVYVSRDSAKSWKNLPNTSLPIRRIAEDHHNTEHLYAVADQSLLHFDGQTWHAKNTLPVAAYNLVVLPGKQPVILCLTEQGVLRSEDLGDTWTESTSSVPLKNLSVIEVARYHMDTAFLGSSDGNLWQSTDRGRTWEHVRAGLGEIRSIAASRLN